MESKRSDKLKELNTLLEMLKEEERKVEKEQNAILKILPEITEARTLISKCQTTYDDHLNFLRSNNNHCPSERIKEFESFINTSRRLIETFSPTFKALRVLQADIVSKLNLLGQTQTRIESAQTEADLNDISLGAPFPLISGPPLDAHVIESKWIELAILNKVKTCFLRLRCVVEEEKAELRAT